MRPGPTSPSVPGGRRRALPLAAAAARALRRRRGVPRPRRRLALRQVDELEGIDDDRLRAALQSDAAVSAWTSSSPTPPRSARRSHRTWRASSRRIAARSSERPLAQELAAPPEAAQLLDVRAAPLHLAGHRPGAVNVPVSGSSFATKAGFVLDARGRCASSPRPSTRPGAIRGLHSVAFFDIPGYVLGGGDERTDAVDVDELEELIAAGVTVIDVREEDEREAGTSPAASTFPTGSLDRRRRPSRRQPGGHDLRERRAGRDRRQRPPRPWLRRAARRRRRPRRVAPPWRRRRDRSRLRAPDPP